MTYSDKTHGAGRLGAIVGHESFRTENGASFSQICDKEMLRKHDHQRNGQFDNLTSEIISSFRENLQQVFATRQAQHLSMTAGVKLPVLETLLPISHKVIQLKTIG